MCVLSIVEASYARKPRAAVDWTPSIIERRTEVVVCPTKTRALTGGGEPVKKIAQVIAGFSFTALRGLYADGQRRGGNLFLSGVTRVEQMMEAEGKNNFSRSLESTKALLFCS